MRAGQAKTPPRRSLNLTGSPLSRQSTGIVGDGAKINQPVDEKKSTEKS